MINKTTNMVPKRPDIVSILIVEKYISWCIVQLQWKVFSAYCQSENMLIDQSNFQIFEHDSLTLKQNSFNFDYNPWLWQLHDCFPSQLFIIYKLKWENN